MKNNKLDIFVFADWIDLEEPTLIGTSTKLRYSRNDKPFNSYITDAQNRAIFSETKIKALI